MEDQRIKILIVEDNQDHALLSRACLEKAGYQVWVTASSRESFMLLQEQHFDIVLLDYHLPEEDGLTTLKKLYKKQLVNAPVVLVTGHGHEKIAVEAMKAGAFDYVAKSSEYPAFLPNLVKRVLDRYKIYAEKKRMETEVLVRNRELEVLNAVSEVVNQSLIADKILQAALNTVAVKLDLDASAIYLLAPKTDSLYLQAGQGGFNNNVTWSEIALSDISALIHSDCEDQSFIFNNVSESNHPILAIFKEAELQSGLIVSIKHKDQFVGLLTVGSKQVAFFTDRHARLLISIANQISMAVENARLFSQAENLNKKFKNLFDSSLDLIVTLDTKGRIHYFNERFADFLGMTTTAVYGKTLLEFVPDHMESFFVKKFSDLKKGKSAVYEAELLCNDGNPVPCLISQSSLRGGNEALLVIKDVSKIVRLQKQLIQSEKLSALGQMISGVAHELNNPLAGILGYSQLLLEESLPVDVREDVSVILKEAKRCQNIVGNLLTFARKQKSERQMVDINGILHTVLELQMYQLTGEGVHVEKVMDFDIPHLVGDFQQLQQVFLHLITNARHALLKASSEDKKLVVTTSCTKKCIRIVIEDNGVGIPPEFKTRIFDPFFTTKEIGEGTGLGLSICFGIIESHNGVLSVLSELDVGSKFTIELPTMTSEMELESAANPEQQQSSQMTIA